MPDDGMAALPVAAMIPAGTASAVQGLARGAPGGPARREPPVAIVAPEKAEPPRRRRGPARRRGPEGPRPSSGHIGGRITLSITWITPFEAATSAVTTLAPFTLTPPSVVTVIAAPWTVAAFMPFDRSADITLPATT